MTKPLALSFRITAETAAAIKDVQAFQAQLNNASKSPQIPDVTSGVRSGVSATSSSLAGLTAGLAGALAGAVALGAALKKGFSVNSDIESAQLGVKGLIAALYEVRDAHGSIVEGPQAIAVAAGIAQKEIEKLRIAGLETTATFQELLTAYRASLAVGSSIGFDPSQVRELTVGLVQAAGTMGLAMDQMKSEVNALFTGDLNVDSQLANQLGIEREDVQRWRAAGADEFYAQLNERLKIFKLLGDEAGKTWQGTLSATGEAAELFIGKMSEGAFDKVKTGLTGALDGLFDKKTMAISDDLQGVLKVGTQVFDGLGTVLADAISGGVELAKDLSAWFTENADEVAKISNAFGLVYDLVGGVLKSIFGAIGATAGWATGAGVVSAVLGGIALNVAMIQDGFQLMKMFAAQVGAVIVDKIGGSLRSVLGSLRDFLSQIPGIGSSLAKAVDSIVRAIPASGAGLKSFADGIKKDFDNGNTAVARTNAELAKTGKLLRGEAAQRERNRLANAKAGPAGTATGKPKGKGEPDGNGAAKKAADAYAAALRTYAEAEADAAKKISQAQREIAQSTLEEALAQRLVTQEQYLAKKAELERTANAEEIAALRSREQFLSAERAKSKDAAQSKKLDADLIKLQGDIKLLEAKGVSIDTKLRIDMADFKRQVESLRIDITANILDLEGNQLGSGLKKLQQETADLLNDPRVRGDASMEAAVRRQAQLKEERLNLDEQKRVMDERVAYMRLAEERIGLAAGQGGLTQIEAERAVRAERLKTAGAILAQVKALEALAAAQPENGAMALEAQRARLEYEKLNGTLDATATSINSDLASSAGGFMKSLAEGKNVIQSFGQALLDVFGNLATRVLKQFENAMFNALEGKGGQGAGGALSNFLGGSGFDFSSLLSGFGFAEGGWTGPGSKYQPKGFVHGDEFVFTKAEVQAAGLPFFYSMKNSIKTRKFKGYAEGGHVGGGAAASFASALQLSPNFTNVNNNNMYLDMDEMSRQLGSNSEFARTVAKLVFNDNASRFGRG